MKLAVEKVFKKHNIACLIEHTSVGDAQSSAANYDIVLCPLSFEKSFDGSKNKTIIIPLQNVMSEIEISEKLRLAGIL